MKLTFASLLLVAMALGGCSSGPPPQPPPPLPAKLGEADYWYSKPAVASVSGPDYQRLWDACDDVAHHEFFSIDVQDYREGIMVTTPEISKQFFEVWRPDTGNLHELIQNSLQSTRRTILFRFFKVGSEYRVVPKVLVERYAETTQRVTSPLQYQQVFAQPAILPQADETGASGHYQSPHWYAIGRDFDMEKDLAARITDELKNF
ncbi:MAG TPA: hypothetical protein VMD30_08840 [Tepidisphaeraceae bacterium]|nr:hypothetical protein [Tepidisphaeraceae bacterium]